MCANAHTASYEKIIAARDMKLMARLKIACVTDTAGLMSVVTFNLNQSYDKELSLSFDVYDTSPDVELHFKECSVFLYYCSIPICLLSCKIQLHFNLLITFIRFY